MTKYIIGAIFIVLAGAVGYYVWTIMGDVASPPTDQTPVVQQPLVRTYATSTYSIAYPPEFTIDEGYSYDQFQGKPIAGVKFTVPMQMATGTNLSATSYVSVEQLPRALSCAGDIYVVPNVRPRDISEGSTIYSVATTTEGAAGSTFEEQVWAIKGSKPCTAIRYFIRTAPMVNFEAGAVREYGRAALLLAFDEIRRSLVLSTTATSTALTP